ncbi:hypothetical protein BH24ACT6_BH24ACT6_00970 [soil metagenome]
MLSLVCFLVGALAPVVPWFFDVSGTAPKVTSLVIGAAAAAVVGVMLGRLSERPLAPAVIRQVLIVLAACAVTYLVGRLVGINVS